MTMARVTIKEASKWATDYLAKNVSPANIAYLAQHGRVKKYRENGLTLIDLNHLKELLRILAGWARRRVEKDTR